jgi:hypothetical protein
MLLKKELMQRLLTVRVEAWSWVRGRELEFVRLTLSCLCLRAQYNGRKS